MDQGILTIHFTQATEQACRVVACLDSIFPLQSQLSSQTSYTYDKILFFLKQMHAHLFSLINELNHILSWTSTSYSPLAAPLRVHIPHLVKELLIFWDVWGRYLDSQHGFGTFHDDVTAHRISPYFRKSLQELLVDRQLERDFRMPLSDRKAA